MLYSVDSMKKRVKGQENTMTISFFSSKGLTPLGLSDEFYSHVAITALQLPSTLIAICSVSKMFYS